MQKRFYHQLILGTTALSLAGAWGAPAALAQNDGLRLEEIVVTAQKREESLQEVPIQVTAFTAQGIEDAGITNTQDFVNLVPNMSLDDSFTYLNTFVVVRGVTQINNADAPIAIVIDGVPQNNQKQFKMNLFDVERIEVLKGPQGALYGRNAIGGAVNIVTKAPSNRLEGFANASYGNGDALRFSGGISGPIVEDKVMARVAAFYTEDNGRIDNTFLGDNPDFIDHDYGIRGRITVAASESVDLDFRASYSDFDAGGLYDSAVFSGDANDFVEPQQSLLGRTFGDILELSFKFDADLQFATLTGITGYTDLTENNRGDLDFSNPVDKPNGFLGFGFQAGQGQDLSVELLSQELRLVSPDDQRLRWIVGAYYIHTDRALRTRAFIDLDGTLEQIDNGIVIVDLQEDNSNDAYAVFGQIDFDITEALTLSGALRYDRDEREQTDLVSGAVRDESFEAIQPKLTLTYHLSEDALAYATYSTGFRSGGFNAPTVSIPVFDDEYLQNYELGFKSSWADNRVILNGAVYFSQVDDFQFFFVDVSSASQVIANIDDVEIFGVELEVQALVAEGLQVFGAVGTTDSEIQSITVFPGNEGNKTPKTTDWTLNAGFQYRAPITNGFDGFVRVDYEHRGKKYWQVDNADVQGSIDLLNVRVGVESEMWGLYFWGRNITDEEYYTDFNPREFSGLDIDIGFLAQPATYGIEGKIRF
ncbi:MAG: TonB-dependent receptor [Alphaproteobacteria bacterium]|nr:MAG: TonB-dependent receptor [Alphaproteobacteria bacterium]